MANENWEKVKEVFDAALRREPEERAGFLDEICADDLTVRREVESLLSSFDRAESFMDTPIVGEMAEAVTIKRKVFLKGHHLGHYEIIRQIGTGGMGEVYLAQDTRLNRRVALKVLPSLSASNQEASQRLWREARAAATLDHPHICAIHEIVETDDCNFIVMQYVEGETLADRLKREKMNLRDVLNVANQVADALEEAHAHGIIHRDIKPANIIVNKRGQAKVLDFGLAKFVVENLEAKSEAATANPLSKSGAIMGTVPFMSPEQVRGKRLDARTDIFSFGATLYEMSGGQQAFARDTDAETISAILRDEPSLADIPDELRPIVQKCLAKNADDRYQTVKDLTADLRELQRRSETGTEWSAARERFGVPPSGGKSPGAQTVTKPARPTSSAEYLLGEIKRHKSVSIIALVILLLAIVGLSFRYFSTRSASMAPIDSIAVLPFQNVSGNSDTEYLSDGISETLINSLTELQRLKVIARATAFRYKGKQIDPQTVGRELNVRAVLMGQVRQMGDTLNVQVDLVDATTGGELWGKEYERKVSDALAVKQTIAREVTEKLSLKLSSEQQQQLAKRDTTNSEAYQLYLRGRYFWNKRTADALRKAIDQFQQSIDRDPNFALGYVGLADSYVMLEEYAEVRSLETLPKARAAADRALQIDDSLAEAHTSSAIIYSFMWRWAEAEEEFKRAISLNPNYPTAHQWFAGYFQTKRQFDDALREIKRAHELDPLSPVINHHVAWIYLFRNDLNSVIEQCQKMIELDLNSPGLHYFLGSAYLKQRRYREATAEFQKAVELSGRASLELSRLSYCYAVTGKRAEALRILKELEGRYARREALGLDPARVYAELGEKDQAFTWLERDFERHSSQLPSITFDYSFDDLRSDPRYADLVRSMGL